MAWFRRGTITLGSATVRLSPRVNRRTVCLCVSRLVTVLSVLREWVRHTMCRCHKLKLSWDRMMLYFDDAVFPRCWGVYTAVHTPYYATLMSPWVDIRASWSSRSTEPCWLQDNYYWLRSYAESMPFTRVRLCCRVHGCTLFYWGSIVVWSARDVPGTDWLYGSFAREQIPLILLWLDVRIWEQDPQFSNRFSITLGLLLLANHLITIGPTYSGVVPLL